MRKICIGLLLLVLAGCKPSPPTAEEIAREKIKEYILANARNPQSYEPMEWGTLDSVFTTSTPTIDSLERVYEICNISLDYYFKTENLTGVNNWMEALEKTNARLIDERNNFVPEFIGWRLSHKYRATNEYGALDIYQQNFTLDIDMSQAELEITEEEEKGE